MLLRALLSLARAVSINEREKCLPRHKHAWEASSERVIYRDADLHICADCIIFCVFRYGDYVFYIVCIAFIRGAFIYVFPYVRKIASFSSSHRVCRDRSIICDTYTPVNFIFKYPKLGAITSDYIITLAFYFYLASDLILIHDLSLSRPPRMKFGLWRPHWSFY